MLDIGWSELLVVAIVAIVVVGPKDLPRLMRTFGVYAGMLRRAAADFQHQFKQAVAESEADEVAKNIEAIRSNMVAAADFGLPTDKPLMTPPTSAPHSIEQAIAPEPEQAKSPAKRTPRKKVSASKTPAKKAVTKKATAKRKPAAPRKPEMTKKTAARTQSTRARTTKTRPKR